jgi:hypothetical protein
MNELLEVMFSVNMGDGGVKGRLLNDLRPVDGTPRTKIVVINGFKPENRANWRGPLPEDEEVWLCEEIRDSRPEVATSGAIIVRLRENLTAKKQEALQKEMQLMEPVLDVLRQTNGERREEELLKMARGLRSYSSYCLEIVELVDLIEIIQEAAQAETLMAAQVILRDYDPSFTEYHVWEAIQQYDADERVRMHCIRAIIAWLQYVLDHGFVENTAFTLGENRFFKCPRCSATTKLPHDEWQRYYYTGQVEIRCLVCGVEGIAKH